MKSVNGNLSFTYRADSYPGRQDSLD
jgi:hypothetical protein